MHSVKLLCDNSHRPLAIPSIICWWTFRCESLCSASVPSLYSFVLEGKEVCTLILFHTPQLKFSQYVCLRYAENLRKEICTATSVKDLGADLVVDMASAQQREIVDASLKWAACSLHHRFSVVNLICNGNSYLSLNALQCLHYIHMSGMIIGSNTILYRIAMYDQAIKQNLLKFFCWVL